MDFITGWMNYYLLFMVGVDNTQVELPVAGRTLRRKAKEEFQCRI